MLAAITLAGLGSPAVARAWTPPLDRPTPLAGEVLLRGELRSSLDGSRFDLRQLAGNWIFVMVDGGQCDKLCADKLLMMRQQRLMTGRDQHRIERVWLITDQDPLPIMLMREYEGTHFVRAPLQPLRDFLVLPDTAGAQLQDHIWLIDPSGNLMLRWPKNPEINGVKRDIAKLLKISAGWIRIDAGRAPSAQ